MASKLCPDCDVPRLAHIGDWLDALFSYALPEMKWVSGYSRVAAQALEALFVSTGVMKRVWDKDIELSEVSPRTRVFLRALMRAKMPCYVLKGLAGWTTHIGVRTPSGVMRFDGLPTAEDFGRPRALSVENKWKEKEFIRAQGAPVPEGRTFLFFQAQAAHLYASKTLGYPVAVKPLSGTMARHVTFGIKDDAAFYDGFARARRYGPRILVEEHMPGFVHRVTVVDGRDVFCVRQEPPHITGDGSQSIAALIEEENRRPERGPIDSLSHMQHKILLAADAPEVLKEQGYASLEDVPKEGARVYLRRDPFLRNGGGLVHLTDDMHEDFRAIARRLAQASGIFIVGIDIMAEDITRPMHGQRCGVLEMNAVPFIEMHVSRQDDTRIGDSIVEAMQKAQATART
jgi:D-alanine-D-alanine ligase-like ATP-grasp enzyme